MKEETKVKARIEIRSREWSGDDRISWLAWVFKWPCMFMILFITPLLAIDVFFDDNLKSRDFVLLWYFMDKPKQRRIQFLKFRNTRLCRKITMLLLYLVWFFSAIFMVLPTPHNRRNRPAQPFCSSNTANIPAPPEEPP